MYDYYCNNYDNYAFTILMTTFLIYSSDDIDMFFIEIVFSDYHDGSEGRVLLHGGC